MIEVDAQIVNARSPDLTGLRAVLRNAEALPVRVGEVVLRGRDALRGRQEVAVRLQNRCQVAGRDTKRFGSLGQTGVKGLQQVKQAGCHWPEPMVLPAYLQPPSPPRSSQPLAAPSNVNSIVVLYITKHCTESPDLPNLDKAKEVIGRESDLEELRKALEKRAEK